MNGEQQTEPTPGQKAVALALLEWHKLIGQKDKETIDRYRMQGVGWMAKEWCGTFVAWCYRQIGLHPDVARLFASDYKLGWLYGHYQTDHKIPYPGHVLTDTGALVPLREYHAAHGGQRVCLAGRKPLSEVQRGDVALVGKKQWGGHIAMVLGLLADGAGISTVSGNGYGYWPASYTEPLSTRKVSGVVVADVPWSSVAYIIRPAPADLDRDLILRRGSR